MTRIMTAELQLPMGEWMRAKNEEGSTDNGGELLVLELDTI